MTDGFAGFQTPNSTSSDLNSLTFIINQMLGKVGTMIPVKVVSSTSGGELAPPGTVNIVPLVNQIDGNGDNSTPHGTIFNVPFWRLQGGATAFIVDPVDGDIGVAFCAMRDISTVVATKAQANPGSLAWVALLCSTASATRR